MQRIAAPVIGGMITAPLLSMFVIPAAYLPMRRRGRAGNADVVGDSEPMALPLGASSPPVTV